MSDLFLPTVFALSGGYTLAPSLPLVGGVESAVELAEVVQLAAVAGPTSRVIPATGVALLDIDTLLGPDSGGGVLVVEATGAVQVECSGVLDARGTFLALVLDANLLTGSLSITNLSATSAVSVRFCIGSAR